MRAKVAIGLALVVAALALAVPVGAQTYRQPAHLQVITVSAPSSTSTYATVEAWAWQPTNGKYRRVAWMPLARVGASGVGVTNEGSSRTPAGHFQLSQPFGVATAPSGMTMPYFKVDRNDIWSDSSNSAYGNRRARCAPGTCSSVYGSFERLSNYPAPYKYAAFINYNAPAPYGSGVVRGKGSAFFLHVKGASPTAGCVAVGEAQLVWLLRWMRPGSRPTISIGVGSAAYAPIPKRYV